jgi:phage shock protein PspC (stress-responsive transcriptional regulator)
MLETMTSTPEPDDRRAETDQTADTATGPGFDAVPDHGSDADADRSSDTGAEQGSDTGAEQGSDTVAEQGSDAGTVRGAEDAVPGDAGGAPDDVADDEADDEADDLASVADRADDDTPISDAHDGATGAMEPPGDAASDETFGGAIPDDSAAAHPGAASTDDTRPFGTTDGGTAAGDAAAGAAAAPGGPPPWTSAASGAGTGFVPPWATHRSPPPPPPGTSGYATRYGLVRPVHNRYIAGVCGAFARATNTDPVLWRVALPVLTVLGGFGILVYLLGWLLIPAEGDSASPIEALFRHGRSSTSKLVTIVLGIISAAWIVGTFSTGIGWKIVVAAAVVGAVVVIGGSRGNNTPRWSTRPVEPQPGPDPYGYGWYAASGQMAAGVPTAGPPAAGWSVDPIATASGTGWPESTAWSSTPAAAPGTRTVAEPIAGVPHDLTAVDGASIDDPGWQPPAYRPPFAPGGPYAQGDPYAPTTAFTNLYDDPAAYPVGFPGLTPDTPTPPPPPPPAQRRRSTVARRITLFATVLVVGLLGILDATNTMSVPAPAYFAAALATVGLGLVIGSMFGRVRGPIFLGIVLAIGLVVTSLTSAYHGEQVTIRPTNFAELPTTYEGSVGQVTVDLRKLNFAGQDRRIDLQLSAGQILVKLPPNVDAHVVAKVGAGDTMIFGENNNSGLRAHANVTNDGADGPGGGEVTINANIAFAGLVEVKR